MRPIDKSKKSNIKCEHCKNFSGGCKCLLNGEFRNYWNRCKKFEWRKDRQYIGMNGGDNDA